MPTYKTGSPDVQRLAQTCEQVQDAVNLIAVLGRMREDLIKLKDLENLGTDQIRQHPITRAWVSKIVSLTQFNFDVESKAFDALADLVKGATVEYEVK